MAVRDVPVDPQMDPAVAPVWWAVEFTHGRYLQLLEGMTPEQLRQRPAGFNNSIAALVVHVAGAHVFWAHSLQGQKVPDDLRAEFLLDQRGETLPQPETETAESLVAKLEKAKDMLQEALRTVRAADLDRILGNPERFQFTLRWQLTLIGYHATEHFGHCKMIQQHLG